MLLLLLFCERWALCSTSMQRPIGIEIHFGPGLPGTGNQNPAQGQCASLSSDTLVAVPWSAVPGSVRIIQIVSPLGEANMSIFTPTPGKMAVPTQLAATV